MSPTASRVALLACATVFSTGGAVVKATDLTGFEVAFGRSAIAAVVLWLGMPTWRGIARRDALGVGLPYGATLVLFVVANKWTTAANAIFLQSTAPLWVMALAPRWLGERNRPGDLALAGIIALGLAAFFIGSEAPAATAPRPLAGNLVAACAGLTWAATLVGLRGLARDPRAEPGGRDAAGAATVAGNGIACALALPFLVAAPPDVPSAGDLLGVAYLGLFQIGLAYVLMVRAVRGVTAVEASLLLVLEPVLSPVWAWLAHGELPGPWSVLGCVVILAATLARTLRAAAPAGGAGQNWK